MPEGTGPCRMAGRATGSARASPAPYNFPNKSCVIGAHNDYNGTEKGEVIPLYWHEKSLYEIF